MKHILTLATLVFATSCFGQEACPNVHDINSNGTIDIEDFLSILGLFADVDVDEDGVWDSQDDCLDATACNYLASPTEPCGYLDALGECGGACEGDGDGDGICDDVDTCVGELDECGVCNGPGPTEVVIEDIVITYDSVFLPLDDDWYVFPISADTTFGYTCAPLVEDCGIVNYQGYDYATVLIGEQCWFAENLRSENYKNGDAIPAGLSDNEWGNTSSGAVAVHGEGGSNCISYSPDGDACDEDWSLNEYGRLYNGHAVDDARGLCPNGWHVPTDAEWTVLTDNLGGAAVAGGKMKTTYGWIDGNNGTNSSGFSGLPGGYRYSQFFTDGGLQGLWWGSSPNGSEAWYCWLYLDEFGESSFNRQPGFSVRCVQDSE